MVADAAVARRARDGVMTGRVKLIYDPTGRQGQGTWTAELYDDDSYVTAVYACQTKHEAMTEARELWRAHVEGGGRREEWVEL